MSDRFVSIFVFIIFRRTVNYIIQPQIEQVGMP